MSFSPYPSGQMKYVLQIYELNSVRPNLLLVEKAVIRIKTVPRRIHRCAMDSARRAEIEERKRLFRSFRCVGQHDYPQAVAVFQNLLGQFLKVG